MRGVLFRAAYGALIASGFFNMAAIAAGLHTWFDHPWWLAGLIGFGVGNIPWAGSATAACAALDAWNWPIWAALFVLAGPSALFVFALRHAEISDGG